MFKKWIKKLKKLDSSHKIEDKINRNSYFIDEDNLPSLKEILENVNSIDDILRLDKIALNSSKDKTYNRYSKAYEKACGIVMYYQFLPELHLNSKDTYVNHSHTVVPAAELKEFLELTKSKKIDWDEISADLLIDSSLDEVIEKKPNHITILKQYKSIVSSKITFEEKVLLTSKLVQDDLDFRDEYFSYYYDGASPDFVMFDILESEYGIIMVDSIYEGGFKTPDEIIKITEKEGLAIYGIGPNKWEVISKGIRRLKKDMKTWKANQ